MRKIEVYDKFRKQFKDLVHWDLLTEALQVCASEALQSDDKEMLKIILLQNCQWVRKVTSLERKGKKAIPNRIWQGAARHLDRIAEQLIESIYKVDFDAPESDEERDMNEEIKQLQEQQKSPSLSRMDNYILFIRQLSFKYKLCEYRKPSTGCYFASVNIEWREFWRIYFNNKFPISYDEGHVAFRNLAGKFREFAELLRNAEP